MLHIMAGIGNEEATTELLSTDTEVDPNAQDGNGLTPF